jgi:nucleoside-diphosphate-sugar epimerase
MKRIQIFDQPSFVGINPNLNFFDRSVVGLTGGSGVLGRILSKRLIAGGVEVDSFVGDVNSLPDLLTWLYKRKFSYFFHLAAKVPVDYVDRNLLSAYQTNVIGTFNVLNALVSSEQEAWTFWGSTSHVYAPKEEKLPEDAKKDPVGAYGITKLHAESMIEFLAKKYQIQSCIGRIFSYSHMFQKEPFLVPSLLKKIELLEDNQDLFVPNLDSMRDILDGETVVDILIELARGKHTGIFNVASGSGKSIGDIANELCVLQSRKLNIIGENFLKPNSYIADVSKLSNAIKIG